MKLWPHVRAVLQRARLLHSNLPVRRGQPSRNQSANRRMTHLAMSRGSELDDRADPKPVRAHTPCWLRGMCVLTGGVSRRREKERRPCLDRLVTLTGRFIEASKRPAASESPVASRRHRATSGTGTRAAGVAFGLTRPVTLQCHPSDDEHRRHALERTPSQAQRTCAGGTAVGDRAGWKANRV